MAAPAAPAPEAPRETGPAMHPEVAVNREEYVREIAPPQPTPAPVGVPSPGYAPAVPVKIEWPADLVQVESDPAKVTAAEQEIGQEQPAPRPKRVRQPLPPVSEEPLVQIETGQPEAAAPDSATRVEKNATTLPG
jgi:ribonuclease E